MKNREFKDILRDLRTEHELSQKELAKRLGVSGSTISMYERGERRPEFDMLEKMADMFHVDMNYLLGHVDYVARLSGDETDPEKGVDVIISPDEQNLIYHWRHADDQTRRIVAYALKLSGWEQK